MTGVQTRVIGIGQPVAGDDYVGIAVTRALRELPVPTDVEIHEITDPARLVQLLDGVRRAILVDALVSNNGTGNIMCLTPEELAVYPFTPLSTHDTSVADAIKLARTLEPATTNCAIHIIGITIEPPTRYTRAISAPVAAAVPRAMDLILDLLEGNKTPVSA